jgi:hypothetical protein
MPCVDDAAGARKPSPTPCRVGASGARAGQPASSASICGATGAESAASYVAAYASVEAVQSAAVAAADGLLAAAIGAAASFSCAATSAGAAGAGGAVGAPSGRGATKARRMAMSYVWSPQHSHESPILVTGLPCMIFLPCFAAHLNGCILACHQRHGPLLPPPCQSPSTVRRRFDPCRTAAGATPTPRHLHLPAHCLPLPTPLRATRARAAYKRGRRMHSVLLYDPCFASRGVRRRRGGQQPPRLLISPAKA